MGFLREVHHVTRVQIEKAVGEGVRVVALPYDAPTEFFPYITFELAFGPYYQLRGKTYGALARVTLSNITQGSVILANRLFAFSSAADLLSQLAAHCPTWVATENPAGTWVLQGSQDAPLVVGHSKVIEGLTLVETPTTPLDILANCASLTYQITAHSVTAPYYEVTGAAELISKIQKSFALPLPNIAVSYRYRDAQPSIVFPTERAGSISQTSFDLMASWTEPFIPDYDQPTPRLRCVQLGVNNQAPAKVQIP